jgi:hypothetical protein
MIYSNFVKNIYFKKTNSINIKLNLEKWQTFNFLKINFLILSVEMILNKTKIYWYHLIKNSDKIILKYKQTNIKHH